MSREMGGGARWQEITHLVNSGGPQADKRKQETSRLTGNYLFWVIKSNRECIKKQRHYLANKGPYSQSYGFSSSHVWMCWVPKNWCFWTVVLEKTLESPLDCKEIKPVNPKVTSPEFSLEGLMLKLKLQYFGHLMKRANSLEKTLMLGKTEGKRRRGWQRMRWFKRFTTQWTWILANSRR